ncbi:MAG: cupin domain-containing protein [Terracidiphilus sp.]|jgi:XRE family transcriptional regulator, regulator of sulfur utilization
MTMTRRDALFGLMALSGALTEGLPAAAAADTPQPILGPTVFHWDEMKFAPNAVGAQAPLCKQPTATLDQLEMHVSKLDPGKMSHPPHRHVNEELIILKEGACETLSNGQWVRVEAGSVVFNASNSLHGFRNIGATPAVYHVINWSPNKDVAAQK